MCTSSLFLALCCQSDIERWNMSNVEDSSGKSRLTTSLECFPPFSGIVPSIWGHLYHLTCADGNQSGPQWGTSLLSGFPQYYQSGHWLLLVLLVVKISSQGLAHIIIYNISIGLVELRVTIWVTICDTDGPPVDDQVGSVPEMSLMLKCS